MDMRLALALVALTVGIAGFAVQHWDQIKPQRQLVQVPVIVAGRDGVPGGRVGGGSR